MFKKIFKKKKGKKVVLKQDDHVHHDWAIAILVSFFAIFVVVLISALIFMQTNSIEDVKAVDLEDNNLIDKELLDKTLEYYSDKEEIYLKYQDAVPAAPEL